jgi:SagB-type dehydrogenase family enzyme
VIVRRGSTRKFAREAIGFQDLSTLLERSLRGIDFDFASLQERPAPESARLSLTVPYLIVNAVEGLGPGAYVYHTDLESLELLKAGDFRDAAGYLALHQDLAADASLNIYFLADLQEALERFGNRGYRAAQLEAAICAGRLYLAAYALGLGASGLTFFDDAVTEFFSPHAEGMSVMFLIAIGKKWKRKP